MLKALLRLILLSRHLKGCTGEFEVTPCNYLTTDGSEGCKASNLLYLDDWWQWTIWLPMAVRAVRAGPHLMCVLRVVILKSNQKIWRHFTFSHLLTWHNQVKYPTFAFILSWGKTFYRPEWGCGFFSFDHSYGRSAKYIKRIFLGVLYQLNTILM